MSDRSRLVPAIAALVAAWLAAPPMAGAITGVCPDGSIFIVQSADAVPCSQARRVDPTDMPPIQPKLLPRPYGWERFNRRADPNNPYNLVGEPLPGGAPPPPAPVAPPVAPTPAPPTPSGVAPGVAPSAPPQVASYAPAAPRKLDLALTPQDVADLDEIVALLQEIAPASVPRYTAEGRRSAVLELAHSPGFEQRLHEVLAQEGGSTGPVLLFRAAARDETAFHGNLTFVQGHVAFHPDPANPEQLGVIDGALGPLAAGDRVLGYAVLPAHLDPSRPLDVYWNDRRITATLRPR